MDPILMQKQVRDNASDLQDFFKEISEWGDEMRQKDKLLIDKQKTEKPTSKHTYSKKKKEKSEKQEKSIKGLDYSLWDKYDVEAECAKLDQDQLKNDSDVSEDLSDDIDESIVEQAVAEKEKGNEFVKLQKWNEAIKCYTQAINYYGYDPVFFANRALCHLKMENYKAAESDCTVALQFSNTYVKAYQRRAAARESLNQLEYARQDLLKVFDYEPNNKESKTALMKLEKKMNISNKPSTPVETVSQTQRPKSKFSISRSQAKANFKSDITLENDWFTKKNVEIVKPIRKPAHLRSDKPLKRIKITEVDNLKKESKIMESPSLPIFGENQTLICDELKVIEKKFKDGTITEITKPMITNTEKLLKEEPNKSVELVLSVPQTSVQFLNDWTKIKSDPEKRINYLKKIKPSNIPKIFQHSLESNIFSDLLKTLSDNADNIDSYDYLMALTEVKRFATLAMFMTSEEKKCVIKLVDSLKSGSFISNDKIDYLLKKYEINI